MSTYIAKRKFKEKTLPLPFNFVKFTVISARLEECY